MILYQIGRLPAPYDPPLDSSLKGRVEECMSTPSVEISHTMHEKSRGYCRRREMGTEIAKLADVSINLPELAHPHSQHTAHHGDSETFDGKIHGASRKYCKIMTWNSYEIIKLPCPGQHIHTPRPNAPGIICIDAS